MSSLDEGKQISVAEWRTHIEESIKLLVPGDWQDYTEYRPMYIHKSEMALLGKDLLMKPGFFVVRVFRHMRSETWYKADYPKTMDTDIGHRFVRFECIVRGGKRGFGFGNELGRNENLDTVYEVAEFVRTSIQNYRPEDGDDWDRPLEPEPTPGEQAPVGSPVPVLSASKVDSAIDVLLKE